MKRIYAASCIGVVLLFASTALVLLQVFPKKQHHFAISHDFGIGFDLSPAYACAPKPYPVVLI